MNRQAHKRKRWLSTVARGQAVVEFTLTALTWTTIIFAIASFSLAVYGYSFVCQASRDAVRYAMVRGSDVPSNSQADCDAIKNVVTAEAHGIAGSLGVACLWGPGPTPTKTSPSGNNAKGNVVKVTVTYSFQPLYPMLSTVLPLTSSSQMVIVY